MDYKKLAELLFADIEETPSDLENEYPPRKLPDGAKVTRLGPSPTGFIHLGNLYGAFVDERLAHKSGGVFFLRIEDTDDKRYVDGAVDLIISSLEFFGIKFDEGATLDGENGKYGSYTQSKRKNIYAACAKQLVAEGKAYPCFLTEEEIADIRKNQEENKEDPGIYGKYAKYRDLPLDKVKNKIDEGQAYVIRLKSTGEPKHEDGTVRKVFVEDAIRGVLEMPENFHDTIIMKTTGIPTYHFAHAVDDHFMRTTHVVRGAEWLSSLSIHVELFEKLGFEIPVYCHTAQLMKLGEDGNKRKLSKRKDPELSLEYYRDMGYHPAAVREYLLTILNSNFEEWRADNELASIDDFEFTTEKMSNSGALFDINKLNDISKDVLLRESAHDLYDFLFAWAKDFRGDLLNVFEDREYMEQILDIGRNDKKPRKDLVCASQILNFISYFYDELYEREDDYPVEVSADDVTSILTSYLDSYEHQDDQSDWFDKIRNIGENLGYAPKPKLFKKNPEQYKGHVGHVSTVIRIALMGRATSPDIWTIQQIMGETMVRNRISESMRTVK